MAAMVGRLHQMEYLLQGSVAKENVETLLHRLRGLCDNTAHDATKFADHEMVYTLRNSTNTVTFRARHSLADPSAPWQLRYLGQAEMGDKSRATLLRSCVEVSTSENLTAFLEELGFRFDYEVVLKGFVFYKGHMRITVSQVFRVPKLGDTRNLELTSQVYLVEISLTTAVQQDPVADEVKAFAEHLKPLVHLEKVDHRKLQSM